MKVSALITAYDHERYVAAAIESALMQKADFAYEIVVAEDCSTDGTRAVVQSYEARHPERIRALYTDANLGGVRNFVRGYEACRGEYVALLDGDDYWLSPEKLRKQVDFLEQHPGCSMCSHLTVVLYEDGRRPLLPPERNELSPLRDILFGNFVYTASAMLRKDAFQGFPEWVYDSPFSDWPLWIQVAERGDIGFINEFLAVYRMHEGGVWSSRALEAQRAQLLVFYERLLEEYGAEHGPVLRRRMAHYHADLACVRARLPEGAAVLVVSGGDRELLKLSRWEGRHFPPDAAPGSELDPKQVPDALEQARADGAEFLLFPRPALGWLAEHEEVRTYLAERCRQVSESDDVVLYDVRGPRGAPPDASAPARSRSLRALLRRR